MSIDDDLPNDPRLASRELLRLSTEIVASYAGNNHVPSDQLPDLISSVYQAMTGLVGQSSPSAAERPRPAVAIGRSIQPDYIVCLEDGKQLKMLKRYLRTTYGMTPDEYRARWNLPHDYPMVAPSYAKQRSEFAKTIGLGKKSNKTVARKKAE